MLCHQAELRKLSLNLSQTCGRALRSPLKVSAVDFLFAVLQQFILAGRDLLRSCCCRKSCCCCLLPAAVNSCWKKLFFFSCKHLLLVSGHQGLCFCFLSSSTPTLLYLSLPDSIGPCAHIWKRLIWHLCHFTQKFYLSLDLPLLYVYSRTI